MYVRLKFPKSLLIESLLIGGYNYSHVSAWDGWNYLWEQFQAQQPKETEIRVCLKVLETENDLEMKLKLVRTHLKQSSSKLFVLQFLIFPHANSKNLIKYSVAMNTG